MKYSFFYKEIVEQVRQPINLAIKLLFPAFILALTSYFGAPPKAIVTLTIIMFTVLPVFGSGVGLTNDKNSGLLLRLKSTPVRPASIVIGSALANGMVNFVQFVVASFVLLFSLPIGFTQFFGVLLAGLCAVLFSSLIGVAIGAKARTLGEIHLYIALIMFPLLALSGVRELSLAKLLPYYYLKQALTGMPSLVPLIITPICYSAVWLFSEKILSFGGE